MSSRFVTRRSSRRALPAMRPARSRESASSSCTSPRSSVIARPRIAASGVRRSCETACRNVFFISSSERSRWRRLALDGERPLELCLGFLALGHVEQEPLPVGRLAGQFHQAGLVLHPHDPPVLRDHPVLHREVVVPGGVALCVCREHAVPVVRVDDRSPEGRIGSDVLERVADQVRVARRDVGGERDRRVVGVDLLGVEDRLVLLHDRAELQLGVAEPLLRLLALGDVDQESLPEALVVGLGHERGLVVHPDPSCRRRAGSGSRACTAPSSRWSGRRPRARAPGRRGGSGLARSRGSRSRHRACSRRGPRPGG